VSKLFLSHHFVLKTKLSPFPTYPRMKQPCQIKRNNGSLGTVLYEICTFRLMPDLKCQSDGRKSTMSREGNENERAQMDLGDFKE
jgi:hypothetical protein